MRRVVVFEPSVFGIHFYFFSLKKVKYFSKND